jgi:hypothetical protein
MHTLLPYWRKLLAKSFLAKVLSSQRACVGRCPAAFFTFLESSTLHPIQAGATICKVGQVHCKQLTVKMSRVNTRRFRQKLSNNAPRMLEESNLGRRAAGSAKRELS